MIRMRANMCVYACVCGEYACVCLCEYACVISDFLCVCDIFKTHHTTVCCIIIFSRETNRNVKLMAISMSSTHRSNNDFKRENQKPIDIMLKNWEYTDS